MKFFIKNLVIRGQIYLITPRGFGKGRKAFPPPYEYLLDIAGWLGSIFMSLMFAFAFVTLLFAFFQRKGISMEDISGNWDSLPPVPVKQERVSKGETIAGICLAVAFLIIFLIVPQIICLIYKERDQSIFIPILNTQVVRSKWYLVVGMVIFGVARDLYGYFEGRYTKRLAAATGAANLLSFLCLCLFPESVKLAKPKNTETHMVTELLPFCSPNISSPNG